MALQPNCFAPPGESHPSQSPGKRITGPDRIRPLRSLAMMTNLIGAASFATIDKGPESHLGPPGHLAAPPVEWLRYLVLVHRAAALLHACLRPVLRRRHCVSPILHRH